MNDEEQKGNILRAALAVFTEQGYAGATMAVIAERAGVNPAILYRHFSGKRALFESLGRPELDFPDRQECERRECILQAARRVFSAKGYTAATMDDVALAAGLSKAGVYFYFSSKEQLLIAVLENPMEFSIIERLLEEHLAGPGVNLAEGLVEVVQGYLALFDDEDFASLFRIILSEGMHDAQIAATFRERIIQRGSENVAHHLARSTGRREDELAFHVQALFGMAFTWGLTQRLLADDRPPANTPLEPIARKFVSLFMAGIDADHA